MAPSLPSHLRLLQGSQTPFTLHTHSSPTCFFHLCQQRVEIHKLRQGENLILGFSIGGGIDQDPSQNPFSEDKTDKVSWTKIWGPLCRAQRPETVGSLLPGPLWKEQTISLKWSSLKKVKKKKRKVQEMIWWEEVGVGGGRVGLPALGRPAQTEPRWPAGVGVSVGLPYFPLGCLSMGWVWDRWLGVCSAGLFSMAGRPVH